MVQVVEVVVHLRGRKLALVHDVVGRKRAYIEALCKSNAMSGLLAENVKLTLEKLGVECTTSTNATRAVLLLQYEERLEDDRLSAAGSRSENGAISGYLSPPQDSEAEVRGELGESCLLVLKLDWVVRLEEQVTDSVLSWLWQRATEILLDLSLEKLMRDGGHDSCTISVPAVRTRRTSVGHCAEQLPSIGDDLVGCFALNVADEAYTTRVLFFIVAVKTLIGRESRCP